MAAPDLDISKLNLKDAPTGPTQEAAQKALDAATEKDNGPVGMVFGAIDKNGKLLANVASGKRSKDSAVPMSTDSIFPIWSCTKMIAGIAVMQLVEQGKIDLDEPVEKILPEIGEVKKVDGSKPKTKITMRMLLAHTAGFSYTFFNEDLKEWSEKNGKNEFDGTMEGTFGLPLIAEPGQAWNYSTGIDWAGRALEKVAGMTLGEYCVKNIFEPLGLKDINFGVKGDQKDRLVGSHQRDENDQIKSREHFKIHTSKPAFDSGGAGATSTVSDYLQILVVLINKGKGANGARILKEETVKQMFEDQLGDDFPEKDPLEKKIPAVIPSLTRPCELSPGMNKGWGLTFLLHKEPMPTGRSAGSSWWAGLANLYWMADPVKGVAHMIASQSLPFNDMPVLIPWLESEKALYDNLE